MNRERIVIALVITGILTIIWTGMYSVTPIDEYVPRNTNEAEILTLLSNFQRARKAYDLETYLACLSEEGEFMFAGSLMVSKNELRRLLPPYWEALKTGGRGPMSPNSRESLNGNFLEGLLCDPVITVHNEEAQAAVTFATTIMRWKTTLFLTFHKENGSWQIVHFFWDIG